MHHTSLFCEYLSHEGGYNGSNANKETDEVVPDAAAAKILNERHKFAEEGKVVPSEDV
jgi:hypothetical protein